MMEDKEYIAFGLELIKSEGVFPKVAASPSIFCWIKALHLSENIDTANILILHRQNQNQEWNEKSRNITYQESLKIADYLKQLGIPEKLPNIRGLIDYTADPFTDFSLRINYMDKNFYLNVHSSFGDFGGKDAQQMEELFEYIFGLVGLENLIGHYSEPSEYGFLHLEESSAEAEIQNKINFSDNPLKQNVENICRSFLIPIEFIRTTLYKGQIEDKYLSENTEFYLAIRAQIPELKLIETVPRVVKISEYGVIDIVINSALPGICLIHQAPPITIPLPTGFQFFRLNTQSVYWDGVKRSKLLAIRVPDIFPDLQLAMYVVVLDSEI